MQEEDGDDRIAASASRQSSSNGTGPSVAATAGRQTWECLLPCSQSICRLSSQSHVTGIIDKAYVIHPDEHLADLPDKPSVAMHCCADVSGATDEWQGASEQAAVLTGPEFRQRVLRPDGSIDRREFDVLWPSLRVMGRCSPQDKYTIVRGAIRGMLSLLRAVSGPACAPAKLKCLAILIQMIVLNSSTETLLFGLLVPVLKSNWSYSLLMLLRFITGTSGARSSKAS